jgi:hypothetical protein
MRRYLRECAAVSHFERLFQVLESKEFAAAKLAGNRESAQQWPLG